MLPGTKPSAEPAAPTEDIASLSPTDGLFDAINRGDLVAARDAMNRGANLDARNLLGLTPIDLSVDLGRNEITFMLLSMRSDEAPRRRAAGGDTPPHDIGARDLPPPPRTVARARLPAPSADADSPELPAVETPRLFSGGGGAPIPAAGFLGFDRGR